MTITTAQVNLLPSLISPQTEIKNHMFFSPINWDDLNAKKLTPPFNPNVVRSFYGLLYADGKDI